MKRGELSTFASIGCVLLCAAGVGVLVASHFVPVGFMTVHRWYAGDTPTGVEQRAIVVMDGVLYSYDFVPQPRQTSPAPQADLPYRWHGTKLRWLNYRQTRFGFSLVRDSRIRQWSFPVILVPLALAAFPLWRRGALKRYLQIAIAFAAVWIFTYDAPDRASEQFKLVLFLAICAVLVVRTVAREWNKARQTFPPHHCRNCGYNLTGNVSGVCPECGVSVSRK